MTSEAFERRDEHEPAAATAEPGRPAPSRDADSTAGSPGSPASAPSSAPQSGATGFGRDVLRFLTAFAQAVQKHSMYPSGHPALAPAVETVHEALTRLLQDRSHLSMGIGNTQLTVEGAESDPDHPRFGFLAGRLHRHQLVSLTFTTGIGSDEVADLLAAAGVEADMAEEPLGARVEGKASPWPHIRLQPIRYEQFALARKEKAGEGGAGEGGGRASKLWLGLARAALVTDAMSGGGAAGAALALDGVDEGALARSLEEYSSEPQYAREVLNNLTTLSRELKGSHGEEAEELKRRVSRLIALVKPEALREVLKEAGDTLERRQLLLDASQWMEPQSVVKLVKATAGVEKKDISHFLLLMMSKLAQHAGTGPADTRVEAEYALQEQVQQLVDGWSLDDAVPISYGEALEKMTHNIAAPDPKEDVQVRVEPDRVLHMSLELNLLGPMSWAAVRELCEAGRFADLVEILEGAPPDAEAAGEVWTRFASPDAVSQMLDEASPDFATLDHLVDFLGPATAEPMLASLADSESRAVRRQLFTRLVDLGPEIAPQVVRHLEDDRWFVKRNMLALLGELDEWPEGWSPERYADHSHPAVRREALKIMLRIPEHRAHAVCGLLQDSDPRALALGLSAAQDSAPSAAAPRLIELVENEALNRDLRIMAVRALEGIGTAEAQACFLELVHRRRGWLFRVLGIRHFADASPVMLEALSALARRWPDDPRIRRVVSRAEKSREADIREAVGARADR